MFQDIEPSFLKLVDGAEDFLYEITSGNQDNEQSDIYFNEVVENESVFLEQMDAIVYAYDEEARNSVEILKKTHMALFFIIILIIIFIIRKIIIPLLTYVDISFWKVEESNENLIKIFQTMKGALFVVKRDGQIVLMNRDAERIIFKEKEENQSMNLETIVNWIEFDVKDLIEKVKNDDIRIEDIETKIEDKDGKLLSLLISAVSGIYEGQEVVILNLFDLTAQKKAEEILKNHAIKDELTGLYNRYFLESVLEDEIERSQRYKLDLSVALMDLDHFKKVNDTWGHPVGDDVLKFTANIVKNNIRKSDFVVRIGGEEFLIFMPNTNSKGAMAAAEKIRQAIEKTSHPIIGKFTASFGVAQRNMDEDYAELYNRVDQALYKAKENNRNCVVLGEN